MAKDIVAIFRTFEYDSRDVTVAFNRCVEKMFGKDTFLGLKSGLLHRRKPLSLIKVKTGVNQEIQVATGELEIRGVEGKFNVGGSAVEVHVSKGESWKAEKLLSEVEENLKTDSLYKCRAVTSSGGFMDLSGISLKNLVFNERVLRELNDNLWVLIERPGDCQRAGVKLQRKVLFEGKFGTGKTMSLLVTAKKAIENGFTFFYLEPTAQDISGAIEGMLRFAKSYSPAIIGVEDFDREQRSGNPFSVGRLMASIDGALSKNDQTLVVLTTNHKDRIVGGLKRPGRIDKSIDFNTFSPEDIIELVKLPIPQDFLSPNINWNKVGAAASKFTPVFVSEIATGAILAAISRDKIGKPMVTEEILLNVTEGLREQHRSCEAEEHMGFQK